jgi:hypothetical protein
MENDLTSVIIRNVSVEAKHNFELFCTGQGKTIQQVLREFINSIGRLNEQQIIMQTAYVLCYSRPNLVDSFISPREPLYAQLPLGLEKDQKRLSFATINPTFIYQQFSEWLNRREEAVT